MLSFDFNRTSNVFIDVNVGVKNHNFQFPLILDTYKIMIVMQKLKFIQEFISAINVECLHSSLQAKLRSGNILSFLLPLFQEGQLSVTGGKYVHEVLVNRLGGLSLPRKSVIRLTDCPDMTIDVYRGRKITMLTLRFLCFLQVSNQPEPLEIT